MDIQRYLNLVTSEHSDKPKFMAWLTAALSLPDDAASLAGALNSYFDLDTAFGTQLDIIGVIVGIGRTLQFQPSEGISPVLDDDSYRLIIQAKIAQNSWDGTIPKVYDLWESILPDLGLQVVDHQNMSMTAVVTGSIKELRQQLIANGYIVPKPSGVSINYVSKTNMENNDTSSMIVSGSLQSQDEMVQPPNPVTLAQKYGEMIISQAHTVIIN